jgi:sigma-B regulation protein RsbU (phosphoserine phosphatase)
MAGRILIAHAGVAKAAELEASLSAAGCEIFRAENLQAASHLLHQHPDLLLLDMQLAETAAAEQLAALAIDLELAETFCLRLCSAENDFARLQELAPFACGTISPPGTVGKILEQLNTLLRIRTAEAERNLAQERLVLHRMEVEEGLRSAAQIQHALLPSRLLDTAAFSFAWQFIPCETVGGDLFNLLQLSENCLLAYILDVSGHGVSSAMVTVSVYQSLSDRTSQLVKHPLDHPPFFRIAAPAEVLSTLDQIYPYERFEKFFTMAYLLLDPETGRVRYCNGGHPPPVLLRHDGQLELLETGGTLIGMGGLLPFEEGEICLQPGDRLYLYSDGITEYAAPSGEMFGDQRLIEFFQQRQQTPLDEAAGSFIETLRNFGGGQPPADDISLFCIQFNAPTKVISPSR